MCYLIHIGVPVAHTQSVRAQRSPRVERHSNASVERAMGSEYALFSIADGGCSCSLYSSPEAKSRRSGRNESLRKKYQRLGWAEEKIARALLASNDALTKNQHDDGSGIRADVAEYVIRLVETAGEVRLLVHDYRGTFAEEVVTTAVGRVAMSLDELRTGGRAIIALDTVYGFHREYA